MSKNNRIISLDDYKDRAPHLLKSYESKSEIEFEEDKNAKEQGENYESNNPTKHRKEVEVGFEDEKKKQEKIKKDFGEGTGGLMKAEEAEIGIAENIDILKGRGAGKKHKYKRKEGSHYFYEDKAKKEHKFTLDVTTKYVEDAIEGKNIDEAVKKLNWHLDDFNKQKTSGVTERFGIPIDSYIDEYTRAIDFVKQYKNKSKKVVVEHKGTIGATIADIGAGGKEYNVQHIDGGADKGKKDVKKSEDIFEGITEKIDILKGGQSSKKKDDVITVDENLHNDIDVNNAILKGQLDTSKLVQRKVQIKGRNGVYMANRWVDPKTGMPVSTGKEGKQLQTATKESKDKKLKPEKDFEHRFSVVMSTKQPKSQKIRDLYSLGIYDPKDILVLGSEHGINAADVIWNLKQSFNVSVDKNSLARLSSTAGSEENDQQQGTKQDKKEKPEPTTKDNKIPKIKDDDAKYVQERLKQQRQQMRSSLGLTYKDFFNTYKNTMNRIIDKGFPKSMIAYGPGGMGKTHTLMELFEEKGIRWKNPEDTKATPDTYDAVKVNGSTGLKDMWEIICKNKDKILVFDDCDSLWGKGEEYPAVNWLKAMLDSGGDRVAHYGQAPKDIDDKPLPKDVKFTGKIFFISNLPETAFPQTLIKSRSAAVDLSMNKDESMQMLDDIKYKVKLLGDDNIELDISKQAREKAYDFFSKYKDRLELDRINGRTFAQVADIFNDVKDDHQAEVESLQRMRLV